MPRNQLVMKDINNFPQDLLINEIVLYLTPLDMLNFLSACPDSNIQSDLSQDKIWAFYFQRYLPFINICVENNGNLFFKKDGRYHLIVLEEEDEAYFKKGNQLYIQKGNGQCLLTEYKTAFITEIRHFLKNLKNHRHYLNAYPNWKTSWLNTFGGLYKLYRDNPYREDWPYRNNWHSWNYDLLQSNLLRADKRFMLAAVSRNYKTFGFASPPLKDDREILCATIKSASKRNRDEILLQASSRRRNEVKCLLRPFEGMTNILAYLTKYLFVATAILAVGGDDDSKKISDNVIYSPIYAGLLYLFMELVVDKQMLNAYSFFAKKYPGNHIDSYIGAHEEHKTPDESDQFSDDENVLLELNY